MTLLLMEVILFTCVQRTKRTRPHRQAKGKEKCTEWWGNVDVFDLKQLRRAGAVTRGFDRQLRKQVYASCCQVQGGFISFYRMQQARTLGIAINFQYPVTMTNAVIMDVECENCKDAQSLILVLVGTQRLPSIDWHDST